MPARERILTTLRLFPAVAVLAWRIVARPAGALWQDLLLWLAAYWILTEMSRRPRVRDAATLGLAAYLLGVYASGHLPLLLSTLGIRP
jgi:hypothetical protein